MLVRCIGRRPHTVPAGGLRGVGIRALIFAWDPEVGATAFSRQEKCTRAALKHGWSTKLALGAKEVSGVSAIIH